MAPEDEETVERETAAAEREAAEIGGGRSDPERDPARAPVEDAGGGEAEGFEQAEEALREHAEHREAGGNPKYDRPPAEEPEAADPAYGEADHAESSEDADDAA